MLSDRDIELAHGEAFDFVFGNLPSARRAEFNRHLAGCGYCQAIVEEYSEIGQVIKHLPPHVEPPAELEDRTVAAMVATLAEQTAATGHRPDAEDEAATRAYPIPGRQPFREPETRVQPTPQFQPPAENETGLRQSPADPPAPAGPQARPVVTRLPAWRRSRGRLAAIVAVAAAIITAAIVIPLSLLGSGAATVIPLYATAAAKVSGVGAATGQATARQDASGSWDITLTVQHLRDFGDAKWYECWYIGSKPGQRQVAPVGSFLVSDSRSQTFTMTSAVDPRQAETMVITLQLPSADGAFNQSKIILQGSSAVARLHALVSTDAELMNTYWLSEPGRLTWLLPRSVREIHRLLKRTVRQPVSVVGNSKRPRSRGEVAMIRHRGTGKTCHAKVVGGRLPARFERITQRERHLRNLDRSHGSDVGKLT